MRATDELDMGGGQTLNGVAAGFSVPFLAFDIGLHLGGAETFHFDGSVDQAGAEYAIGRNQGNAAINMVAATREHGEAFAGVCFVLGLIQQAPSAGYGGIGSKDIGAFMCGGDGLGLFDGKAQGKVFGVLTL